MMKQMALVALALGIFCSVSAMDGPERALTVTIDKVTPEGRIYGSFRNEGGELLRIWSRNSRWGIAPWRVHFISDGVLHTYYEEPNQIWGGPSGPYHEIDVGGAMPFKLDMNNNFWRPRSETPIKFRPGDTVIVAYDVPQTDESVIESVWAGVASAMSVVR